jgi:uncharacterized protein
MDITPLIPKGRQIIDRYGNGGFVVSGVAHKGNMLITPQGPLAWNVTSMDDIAPESLAPLFAGEAPEIVLIGAGVKFMPLPARLRAFFQERKVAVDAMDTGAACRTYTVLLSEGRMVAAALIAV